MTAGSLAWLRSGRFAAVALALAGVGQWWLGMAPLALLVASYLAVLVLLTRVLPVRIAISAALLVQHAILLALVLVVPLALGGPLRPGVALGILVVPCLALVLDLLLGRPNERANEPHRVTRVPWALMAAASVGGVVMVGTVLLAGRTDSFGALAWSASGDARLHLLFARMVLDEGGLHGLPFSYQPEYHESLTALLLDTHGRGTLAPGPLLEHDLVGVAQVSTALTVLWTLATTATLLAFAPLRGRGAAAVVAAASLLPVTGLALGVVLRDGFLPILLVVPLVLCGLNVLAWLHTTSLTGTPVTVAVGASAAALPVLAFTWTPYAVVLGLASLWPWWRALGPGEQRRLRLVLMAAGTATSAGYCLYVLSRAGDFVHIAGSIVAPSPPVAVLIPLVVLLIAVGGWSAVRREAFTPYAVGSLAVAGVTTYAVLIQREGQLWNYFPAKIAWIWVLVGLPLLLVPFAHPAAPTRRALPTVAGALAVVLAALSLSPITAPVLPAEAAWLQGGRTTTKSIDRWGQPDAAALRLAVRLGDRRTRYVVHNVDPGNDRLTNFWLAAYDPLDGPTNRDEFINWGYRATGTVADICELLDLQPDRVVATADPSAKANLRSECGRDVTVLLVG
ncbi:hypothetical protein [Nocardioides sp.]|uniref:hypothetical protein n=1 Tax=Nocardioides sp. TaxID=35761 RepID=UPI0035683448